MPAGLGSGVVEVADPSTGGGARSPMTGARPPDVTVLPTPSDNGLAGAAMAALEGPFGAPVTADPASG
ncbi:hypothetical protein SCATT_08090 [Streptantibioticus cattleyicolor NRRL 8057 = DSM 46488]|uniref:Uncharacterized protein n=1 Tax=Streptantibioticus cattleyicolor (strain ATCC 35852 / DSM 46488 / JCM 4925 / NBRC 14057 / NRRL 8057) TaxID=1003195 RepID=F8JWX8_STREN|nr:hypothetical protein SCATT_08090 [Streptantibioticus cattleyicolor NRRL 8057 = DSM 46488]MYS57905.1 hypothetical protein [Streptomyces sp. SID5468]CCB73541.1 protein of unknown function [Streptantibioticus cattleyicolor NRRL 8057 = DSM 46488]